MRLTITHTGLCAILALLPVHAVLNAAEPQPSASYTEFLHASAAGKPSRLPDYSWAGYKFGASAIPDVSGKTFNITDYGAKPDDDIEDRDPIQAAIQAAEAAGGGIVFFPPGRFLVNEQANRLTGIAITKPGIVLRGSGAGPGGTELFMRHHLVPKNPKNMWSTPSMFTFRPGDRVKSEKSRIVADAPRDTLAITVSDASKLKPGDMIVLHSQNTAANQQRLDGLTPWPNWTATLKQGVAVKERHQIAAISGNSITLGEPLRSPITARNGWSLETYTCADGWGVEDLWFRGNFQEKFVHHKNYIHDSGWTFLSMSYPKDAWVRRIRLTDVNEGINISSGYACSVQMITFDGNSGHSMTHASASYGVLVGPIHDATRTGMHHGPGTSGCNVGAVIWRYLGQTKSGLDCHGSWPSCTLVDASSSGLTGNGGNQSALPNHLQDLTYWNLNELGPAKVNYDFWGPQLKDYPNRYTGMKVVHPNIIGLHGAGSTFVREHLGIFESPGKSVFPESLYEAQLQARLKSTPPWLAAVKAEWNVYLATGELHNPAPADTAKNP